MLKPLCLGAALLGALLLTSPPLSAQGVEQVRPRQLDLILRPQQRERERSLDRLRQRETADPATRARERLQMQERLREIERKRLQENRLKPLPKADEAAKP